MEIHHQRSYLSSPSRSKFRRYLRRRFLLLALCAICGAWIYHQISFALLQPEAIFVLGGHEDREKFAADFAQSHPTLPIWVSSGSPAPYAKKIFMKRGITGDRLHLDYRAKDTVTNFTTMVDEFKSQGIDSVYLVTSENHIQRAEIVAAIVFGSRGIQVKPMAVPLHPGEPEHEPEMKSFRDGVRAILWLFTGETGEEFVPEQSPPRKTAQKL